jgi:hypothetical protein
LQAGKNICRRCKNTIVQLGNIFTSEGILLFKKKNLSIASSNRDRKIVV